MNQLKINDTENGLALMLEKSSLKSEVSFAKATIGFLKIRNIENQKLNDYVSIILTRIANLLGIKNPIEDVNKPDILELLKVKYLNLSLEELDYAFKLERFGTLKPKTQHYQNFNAVYVAEVLNKYKAWLQDTRRKNNLKLSEEMKDKELSQDEKDLIVYQGVIDCFENFKNNGKILGYCNHIYDHLIDIKVVSFTEKERFAKFEVAKSLLYDEAKAKVKYFEKVSALKALKQNEKGLVIDQAKKMLLQDFFGRLLFKKKHIKDLL